MKQSFLVILLTFCAVSAGASDGVEKTAVVGRQYELTYGDWHGATMEHIPTMIRSLYYDSRGRLMCSLDARYQLGDSETTLEIEKEGELKPEVYTSYVYNEQGALAQVLERKYKPVIGRYYGWDEAQVVEEREYDEQMHLVLKTTEKDGTFTYVWQGDSLVAETNVSVRGAWNYTKTFSNFVEGASDCARTVVHAGKYQNFYIENTYDQQHRLVMSLHFHLTDVVKDDNGNVIGGNKGKAYMQESWTYEDDLMTCYQSSYWNSSKEVYEPSKKQEYVFSEEEGGVVERTYSYSGGKWVLFGSSRVTIDAVYNNDMIIEHITMEDVSASVLRPNSLRIAFDVPEGVDSDTQWNVYRNGCLLGQATLQRGEMVYVDYEVENGVWDYFVKAEATHEGEDYAASNIITYQFATPLPSVTKVDCIESGLTYVENNPVYAYNLVWNAPETDYDVLGYLVYINPKEGVKNPTSHNVEMLREPRYRLWETSFADSSNTFVIEAVYRIGSVKSEPVVFTLDKTHVMATGSKVNRRTYNVYGDAMGTTISAQPQKVHTFYYDNDNNIVSSIETSVLTGDDPDTEAVEVAGTVVPIALHVYDYDMFGSLMKVRSRAYGMYSGYDMAWANEWTTEASYSYDEMTGLLVEELKEGRKYTYKWQDELKVQECCYAADGTWLYQVDYSNFNEWGNPRSAFAVSKHPSITSYNRIYESEYDEEGRLIVKREYKFGPNVEKDNEGNIVNADKGNLYIEELWTYVAGRLVLYEQNRYSSIEKKMIPYSKREYEPTATGTRETSYSYTSTIGEGTWTKSSVVNEESSSEYYSLTAPRNLRISDVDGAVNTVKLMCDAPQRMHVKSPVYEVYRNAQKIGEASVDDAGKIIYIDKEVPNGDWSYFVKVASPYDGIEFYTTSVVEKTFNTTLPAVTSICFPENGKTSDGNFRLLVTWEAPQTELEILGYNIYTDIKDFTKNPSPDNGMKMIAVDTLNYTYTWSSLMSMQKTVSVETVYRIGKVKSEQVAVTILETPVGLNAVEANASWTLQDEQLYIDVPESRVTLYDLKGRLQAVYVDKLHIDLGCLSAGVYLLRIETPQGVECCKAILK